jgi:glutamate racemase
MTLGVFDSGLGGLTVLRRLRRLLPAVDLVYFADQRHVPYGDRADADLLRLLAANVAYLAACGSDAIVMGCNTSCAIAASYGWPAADVPIFDLIAAAADAVVASGARRVGVLATSATARTGAYGAAIRARDARIFVREVAAPGLVPLVEAGVLGGPRAEHAVAAACAAVGADIDALVLACTHYPLLDAVFARALGPAVLRIDPAEAQALRAADWVRANYGASRRSGGRTRYVTSGPLDAFGASIVALAGPLDDLENVEEQQHGDAAEQRTGDDLSDRVRLEVHARPAHDRDQHGER